MGFSQFCPRRYRPHIIFQAVFKSVESCRSQPTCHPASARARKFTRFGRCPSLTFADSLHSFVPTSHILLRPLFDDNTRHFCVAPAGYRARALRLLFPPLLLPVVFLFLARAALGLLVCVFSSLRILPMPLISGFCPLGTTLITGVMKRSSRLLNRESNHYVLH